VRYDNAQLSAWIFFQSQIASFNYDRKNHFFIRNSYPIRCLSESELGRETLQLFFSFSFFFYRKTLSTSFGRSKRNLLHFSMLTKCFCRQRANRPFQDDKLNLQKQIISITCNSFVSFVLCGYLSSCVVEWLKKNNLNDNI